MKKDKMMTFAIIAIVAIAAGWFLLPKIGIEIPGIPSASDVISGKSTGAGDISVEFVDAQGNIVVPKKALFIVTPQGLQAVPNIVGMYITCGATVSASSPAMNLWVSAATPASLQTAMPIGSRTTNNKPNTAAGSSVSWKSSLITITSAMVGTYNAQCSEIGEYEYPTGTFVPVTRQTATLPITIANDPTGDFSASINFG